MLNNDERTSYYYLIMLLKKNRVITSLFNDYGNVVLKNKRRGSMSFTERAVALIKQIPSGKVMTYGQIAGLAGSPRGARQVVRVLHSMSKKHNLPWHRVINSKGEIGFKDEEMYVVQKLSLEAEGILVSSDGKLDLKVYLYEPDEHK
jgi:methylated-DNA-protein-cysteine methyltransferase-like protein